jgi:hypothetical protein
MYKKLVRIFKNIKSNMEVDTEKISSFLIESLIWNVRNDIIMNNGTWNETVRNTIWHLLNAFEKNQCNLWKEPSKCIYLFDENRKWTQKDAKDFLFKMWQHMGYK